MRLNVDTRRLGTLEPPPGINTRLETMGQGEGGGKNGTNGSFFLGAFLEPSHVAFLPSRSPLTAAAAIFDSGVGVDDDGGGQKAKHCCEQLNYDDAPMKKKAFVSIPRCIAGDSVHRIFSGT